MLTALFARKGPAGLCGLQIGEQALQLAFVAPAEGGIQLALCEQLDVEPQWPARTALLSQKVREAGLAGAHCNLVLAPGQYQLFMMEAPKVPQEELRDAVRWKVKDLISEPLDGVIVDVMPLADDCGRSGQKLLYAVVAPKTIIEPAIAMVHKAGLKLQSIDIDEMALRNLALRCDSDARGLAVVLLEPGRGSLAMIKQEHLYLSRSFNIQFNGGLLDDIPEEALVLELQRSFDYYERQLGQVPPSQVVLMGENVTPDKLHGVLASGLGANVKVLDLAGLMADPERYDEQVLQQCVGALGGALRAEAVA